MKIQKSLITRISLLLITLLWVNFKSYAEENFKTVRTNHFAYHYADYLQDEASQIANTTEQVAIKLSQKYGVNLDSPVDVRISNALY